MKKQSIAILLILLISMISTKVMAYNIAVENADGVTIYYNILNEQELEVTFESLVDPSSYSGNVVIPDEVTYKGKTRKVTRIGIHAFSYNYNPIAVTIGNNVTSIEGYAFYNCLKLIAVAIPNNVTSIGEYAFYECRALTPVTIPNSVTSIGKYAFYNCSFTSINIPNSVTSIGENAFLGCWGLTSVKISDVAAWCNIKFGNRDSNPLNRAHHLYLNGKEIKDLVIPNSVTSIGNYVFCNCYGLTSVTIPNSVTSIGEYAFSGCSGLTSVTLPNSVTSIGEYAFYGCNSLASITITSGNAIYDSRDNCNAIIETATNTLIYGCKNTIIPNSVTSIGYEAFSGCSGLKSVTIPNSVKSIGEKAFGNCTGLTSVTIGNNVTSIGDNAFYGCSGLTSMTIGNNVTSIGDNAFYGCSGLTSVTILCPKVGSWFSGKTSIKEVVIGDGVESIGDKAFYGCSGLTSITIPNSVTSIGSSAFSGCSGLTSVKISDVAAWCNIKFGDGSANPLSYAHHLFLNGEEIKDLVIPSNVTSIGRIAFSGCSGLTSVTIPNSVTSIGSSAFDGCDLLKVISLIENPFRINESTFSQNTFKNATLYIPVGTTEKYKAKSGWRKFVNIEESDIAGINVVENTKNNKTTIYDLNGVRQSEPKKGINIINGKKVVVK